MCCSNAAVVRTLMILGCVIIINISANAVCVIFLGGGGVHFFQLWSCVLIIDANSIPDPLKYHINTMFAVHNY